MGNAEWGIGMRERFVSISPVILTFVIINVCGWIGTAWWLGHSPSKMVKVIAVAPDGENVTDRITIIFDHPISGSDRLAVALERAPFHLEPAVPGSWHRRRESRRGDRAT